MRHVPEQDQVTPQLHASRIEYRDQIDRMLGRARVLSDADRIIIEHLLRQGLSFAQIARLVGSDRRVIARKCKAIIRRLNDPLFIFTTEHLDVLDPVCARIAKAYVLQGMSLRRTAQVLGCTVHRVRAELARLQKYHSRHIEAQRKRHHVAASRQLGMQPQCA